LDQLRRGIEWLRFKNLILVDEKSRISIRLGNSGQKAATEGLPERRLVKAIKMGKVKTSEMVESKLIESNEVNIAIANARRNGWINIRQGESGREIALTDSHEILSEEEQLIRRLNNDKEAYISELLASEKNAYHLLKKRPLYIDEIEERETSFRLSEAGKVIVPQISESRSERHLTPELISSGKWKSVTLSPLDVQAPAPIVFPGKRHPLVNLIDEIKEIFISLGFSEIDGAFVQPSFWNFDALFTPQDHPAREMQDTFYLSNIEYDSIAQEDQIKNISSVHEHGWQYSWSLEPAKKAVLRTHTTPITIRHLADNQIENARVFSVGRVFRNEKVSYKHLAEFNQVEGVVTGPNITLRDLMGLQKEFYSKMGITKRKFWPTFCPYTEPSLQSMVYNDKLEKWV
jgi:phenylalanyl-tRNA synthetase alpha chain